MSKRASHVRLSPGDPGHLPPSRRHAWGWPVGALASRAPWPLRCRYGLGRSRPTCCTTTKGGLSDARAVSSCRLKPGDRHCRRNERAGRTPLCCRARQDSATRQGQKPPCDSRGVRERPCSGAMTAVIEHALGQNARTDSIPNVCSWPQLDRTPGGSRSQ